MISAKSYQPKQFNLSGLNGISDKTLEMHFKLYEGLRQGDEQADHYHAAGGADYYPSL